MTNLQTYKIHHNRSKYPIVSLQEYFRMLQFKSGHPVLSKERKKEKFPLIVQQKCKPNRSANLIARLFDRKSLILYCRILTIPYKVIQSDHQICLGLYFGSTTRGPLGARYTYFRFTSAVSDRNFRQTLNNAKRILYIRQCARGRK